MENTNKKPFETGILLTAHELKLISDALLNCLVKIPTIGMPRMETVKLLERIEFANTLLMAIRDREMSTEVLYEG